MREQPAWVKDRACANIPTGIFYMFNAEDDRRAKRICVDCPVKTECLEHAIKNSETGVWGGMNDLDRVRFVRRRFQREGLEALLPRRMSHVPKHLANEFPVFPSHISSQQKNNQEPSMKAAALSPVSFPGYGTKLAVNL